MTKTGHDVVVRRSDLLQVDHIRFSKHAAASGNPGRGFGFQGYLSELFDGELKSACLLVKERTGASGTSAAHSKILQSRLLRTSIPDHKQKLRVLPSHLDDSLHLRVKPGDGLGLGNYLVDKIAP